MPERHASKCHFESDEYYLRQMRKILNEFPNTGPPSHPVKLLDHVYMGSQRNADNIELLQCIGITHVLNCAGLRRYDFTRSPYPRETGVKGFLMISAEDHEKFDIASHFDDAISFLDKVKRSKGRALVHCNLGVNRSGAIVAAYLMFDQRKRLLDVISYLKMKRFVVLTNKGFRLQLVQFARSQGLLDPVISAEDDPKSTRRVSLSGIGAVASDPSYSVSESLRSMTVVEFSNTVSVEKKDASSSTARVKDRTPEKHAVNESRYENSVSSPSATSSKSYPFTSGRPLGFGLSASMPDEGAKRSRSVMATLSSPPTSAVTFKDPVPVVEVTPSPEQKTTAEVGFTSDKSDTKSRLKPSQLTPVYELSPESAEEKSTSAQKFSGFWTLLGSKRKPLRSSSYSNVSSSTTSHSTSPSPSPSPSTTGLNRSGGGASAEPAPLSTSRPLRVYTRSSTDSELYTTKSKTSERH